MREGCNKRLGCLRIARSVGRTAIRQLRRRSVNSAKALLSFMLKFAAQDRCARSRSSRPSYLRRIKVSGVLHIHVIGPRKILLRRVADSVRGFDIFDPNTSYYLLLARPPARPVFRSQEHYMSSLVARLTLGAVGLTCKAFLRSGYCASVSVKGFENIEKAVRDENRKNGRGIITSKTQSFSA